jgi:hypothetical protein
MKLWQKDFLIADCGLWIADCGLRIVDFGIWILGFEIFKSLLLLYPGK